MAYICEMLLQGRPAQAFDRVGIEREYAERYLAQSMIYRVLLAEHPHVLLKALGAIRPCNENCSEDGCQAKLLALFLVSVFSKTGYSRSLPYDYG